MSDLGLSTVATEHLLTLLRGVFKETIPCPLTPAGLASHGLQDVSGPLLAHLRGLSTAAVHAVLVAVIAERRVDDTQRAKRRLSPGRG